MTTTTKITIELDSPILESVVAGRTFQMDARKMDNRGLAKLLRYGAQRFVNDGTGGSEKTDEVKFSIAETKVERIMTGEVNRISNPSDPHSRLRKYIRSILRNNESVRSVAQEKGVKPSPDFLDSFFDALHKHKRDAILDRAERMYNDEHGDIDI